MIPLGKLEKMILRAYEGDKPEASPVGEYEFLINPESYTFRYQIDEVGTSAPGDTPNEQKFIGQLPSEWEFDILIDGTGIIKDASVLDVAIIGNVSEVDVEQKVTDLKNLIIDSNGDIHRTNYLKISWGKALFKGTAVSLDLNYKLFNSDGSPLRVIAKLKLREWVSNEEEQKNIPKSSPDITHERIFSASDKFSLISHKIYKDSKYYFDVADKNKLNSFRKISIGTKLLFPPIK